MSSAKSEKNVTLFLGPIGHGKSTEIINRIKDDYENKRRAVLIVPEQQTIESERVLCEVLPPDAQFYIEATNFTRLADSVFRKTGGLRYNYVTNSGRNLIMYQALCEVRDLLQKYTIKSREKNCIKLFLEAVTELETYGVDPNHLDSVAKKIEEDCIKEKGNEDKQPNSKYDDLQKRLKDIVTVWTAYKAILKNLYDDPFETMHHLADKLGRSDFFEGVNVYIDSFYGFTKTQLEVIDRIIEKASNVTVAIDCPSDVTKGAMQYKKLFYTKEKLFAHCKAILGKEPIIKSFDDDKMHKTEELKFICDNLWKFDTAPRIHKGDVNLVLAKDEFDECEYVCTKIKELIHKGEEYGKIGIIVRNPSTYQGVIDFCLNKYDIPNYFSAPSNLAKQPVVKMIFSALRSLIGYKSEDIVSYIKCGYTDISTEELRLFESYMYRWSLYGKKFTNEDYWYANPDGYVKDPTDLQIENLETISKTRKKVLDNLSTLEIPFKLGSTVEGIARAIYDFLTKHDVRAKLNKEIDKADNTTAQELSQTWSVLMNVLDTLVTVCGKVKCDKETFITLFEYAIMDSKIGTIPTRLDSVVVADASLVRPKNLKHVFVLGANEGEFPATVKDTSFFSDSDKVTLETYSVKLTPNNKIELSASLDELGDDELLFFKNSIACASHSATVCATKKCINGDKNEASIGFKRIAALLEKPMEERKRKENGEIDEEDSEYEPKDSSTLSILDKIYTEKMASELFGATSGELREAISSACKLKNTNYSFENSNDVISEDTAKAVFENPLPLYQSAIESYLRCPLNYYCQYVLNVHDSTKISFRENDIGNLIHDIFEHFLKLDDEKLKDCTPEKIAEIVTDLTDKYTAKVCGVRALSNKMKHYFARVKSTICIFVDCMLKEMAASKFKPAAFELKINGNGITAPKPYDIPIDDERKIILTGRADRVDVAKEGDTTYLKIYDYKSGSYSFNLNKLNDYGLGTQMIIYLLALCNLKDDEFKKKMNWGDNVKPGGFVYLTYFINKIDDPYETDLDSEEAIAKEAEMLRGKIERSGLELDKASLSADSEEFRLNKNSQIDELGFEEIIKTVKNRIISVGVDILSGNANAAPLEKENPCRYCKNKAVCRRREKNG